MQRVHYINIILEAKGLLVDAAEVAHMEEVMQDDADSDASDIVCANCLSGETTEDNDILICDGEHSKPVGYHQIYCEPPVINIPDHSWLCPECAIQRGQVLILTSTTQIMHSRCLLHPPMPLPRPLPLQAQALTLTLVPQVMILLLMVVVQDLMFLIHQIIHLILKCSANRRPRWGAASLFFVLWDVAGIDWT